MGITFYEVTLKFLIFLEGLLECEFVFAEKDTGGERSKSCLELEKSFAYVFVNFHKEKRQKFAALSFVKLFVKLGRGASNFSDNCRCRWFGGVDDDQSFSEKPKGTENQ